ncbi:unnamed protein product [Closterium sp. NIES-53]
MTCGIRAVLLCSWVNMEAEGSAPAGPSGSGGVRGAGEAGRGVAGGSAPIASVSTPAKDDLSVAGVDYAEKIKCYKALSLLLESWGPLVANLNGMKDSYMKGKAKEESGGEQCSGGSKVVHGAMGEGMGTEEGNGGAGRHGSMFYHVGEACSKDMVVSASKVALHRFSKLPPRHTIQGKCDVVCGGAKEGAAKERPKRAAHQRDFLKYGRLGGPKALLVQEEEDEEEKRAEGEMEQICCFGVNLPHEPASMKEALAGDDREAWLAAREDDFMNHMENETWTLTNLPPRRKALDCTWVLRVKTDAEGRLERRKTRLVIKGFQRKEGIDFREMFAPVAKAPTLQLLLAAAAICGRKVEQMGVKTAFLYGVVDEEIYMKQPEGYDDGNGRVYRLNKAIYGLKKAPRSWYARLVEALEALGFKVCGCDESLFMTEGEEEKVFLLVYVDDILLFSPSLNRIKEVQGKLKETFYCKALGPVGYYLGLHVERDEVKGWLKLHQHKYFASMGEKYGLEEGRSVKTPLPSGFKLHLDEEEGEVLEYELQRRFQSMEPAPIYITLYFIDTRLPDSLRAVKDHFLTLRPTDLNVDDLLEQHLLADETSIVAVGAGRGIPRTPFFEGCQRVSICTSTRTGCHLAMFTRRPGSNLYTLTTKPPQVAASSQVSTSGPVAPPCSCRLLSHQTLLWHHRLDHPSMPRLRGMHSRLLVSGLPRSLPPLPPSPAPPYLPCVEGRQRAAPLSSSFPPTTAPLQTLHMEVWGPARVSGQDRERYFLLVVDDYTQYTTVFPFRSKGEVPDVLIPWICAVRLQLRERDHEDLPVLRQHSDRGGEFSFDLLRDFCHGEGILHSFTLSASLQKNGIAERRIGLVMEVACTSIIHAATPNFLWPFAVRYAAHQLNLWPRVSLPKSSPTLRWTGKVGNASVFRVWSSRAFVRDTIADKLSSRAIPCVFLGFPPNAPG